MVWNFTLIPSLQAKVKANTNKKNMVDISVKLTHQYGDIDPPQTGSIFKNHLA